MNLTQFILNGLEEILMISLNEIIGHRQKYPQKVRSNLHMENITMYIFVCIYIHMYLYQMQVS